MNSALENVAGPWHGIHSWMHHNARIIGFEIGEEAPQWLHMALHGILVITPVAMIVVLGYVLLRLARSGLRRIFRSNSERSNWNEFIRALGMRWSEQGKVVALGLVAQPVLYASLELPKRIVNGAIDSGHFPIDVFGLHLSQLGLLFTLSSLYLCALFLGGLIKYQINVKKGEIGEYTLLRLRLQLYRTWRAIPLRRRKTDIIPLAATEIEPIGGFAGDVLATPVFQGGTLLTVLLFMFMQNPILGAATLTLVPLQLIVVPILQKRVNNRMRARIFAVRNIGDDLGEQTKRLFVPETGRKTRAMLHELKRTRLLLHRAKFLQKAISNFLMTLTPFLFYSIGGWLVIDGRLSLGALVAVIAAFKDFSSPFRELILYYQNLSDVYLRFDHYSGFLMKCRADRGVADVIGLDGQRLKLIV